jgi:hypothetical protein
VSKKSTPKTTPTEGDDAFVRWLARWALLASILVILFAVAVIRNYPFPDALDAIRGPFYTVMGSIIVLIALAFAFLGYRVVTARYGGRTRDIYLLFLPVVLLVTSLIWLLLLAVAA